MNGYAGHSVVLATRHGKERSFADPFRAHLAALIVVPPDLDTDALGTFSGEVERTADVAETARRKAAMGMRATGLRQGLATEGSFGPHPEVPFVAMHHELAMFIDEDRGIEVSEEVTSLETNFGHRVVTASAELDGFLVRVGFPEHGVIVRPAGPVRPGTVHKDIVDPDALEQVIMLAASAAPDGRVHVETDMRAHRNPSRMRVLGALAERLASRLATACPACASPGFGQIAILAGLPCAWCGRPTELTRTEIHGCSACRYRSDRPRPDGLEVADPGRCASCNP